MTFGEYQNTAAKTAVYPKDYGLGYTVLGLAGEAGEVANKVKKIYRDNDGYASLIDIDSIHKELGDCLWYIAAIATEIRASLDDIAARNLAKLQKRMEDGTIKGSGDNR